MEAADGQRSAGTGLRRELRFREAIALSIAIMTPTAAMSTGAIQPAVLTGRAGPLVYLVSIVAIGFVAYGFMQLTRHFSHAGSVYAFAGATLGPRAGFTCGWALFGTYLAYSALTMCGCGIFGAAFLSGTGIWPGASWFPIAIVFGVATFVMTYTDVRVIMRSLLGLEGLSVTLILILIAAIIGRIAFGSAPARQHLTLQPFTLPHGVSFGSFGLATVFAFLSFAGFEGAASLGEETNKPHRDIPRAIGVSVAFASVFYLVCIYAQTVGFGTGTGGIHALTQSSSPLGQLARTYIGSPMSDLINLGITFSSFAGAIGATTAGSRLLFAFGRDGFISRRLGQSSPRTGAPTVAVTAVVVVALGSVVIMGARGVGMFDVYFWTATLGTLSLLVAYIVTSAGAFRLLFLTGVTTTPRWQAVFPIGAVAMLGYTLYSNVYPVPSSPYNAFPYVVAAWLIASLVVVVVTPGLADRIGRGLAASEGMRLGEPVPRPDAEPAS
jgi:amino acid transporter